MSDASSPTNPALAANAPPRVVGRSMGQAHRLIVNTLSNYALTFVTMIAALVMTPIVVMHLGQAGFGMAAMVLAPFGIFEALAGSFGRAIHRFVPLSLIDPDHRSLDRVFSTGLCGYGLMGVIGAGAVWLLSGVLLEGDSVRPAVTRDGYLALNVLIVWLALGFPFWVYRKGLEAIQRFDLLGLIHGIVTLLRMLVVIVVFWLGYGSVTFFVASQLVGLLVANLICRHYLRRCLPDMAVSLHCVDRNTLVLMGAFAGATILGTCGEVLGGYGFRIFIGKAIGLHELGEFAALMTLQLTIFRLIDELTNAFAPAVSALDAQGASANVAKLLVSGTKISIIVAVSMAVVPLATYKPFMTLWLGPVFARRDTLFATLLVLLIPFCLGNTAMHVLYGLGKASICGPVQFARSFVGLVLAFCYVVFFDQGLAGACIIMFGAQAMGGIVMLLYGCSATQIEWAPALRKVLFRPVLISLIGASATYGVQLLVGDDAWWKIAVSVAGGETVFIVLVLLCGVGIEEWQRITSFLVSARSNVERYLASSSNRSQKNDAPR